MHPWSFSGKSTGVGCRFLLQGIFPTQGSNPGLPHYRQTLYHLSHQGSPKKFSPFLKTSFSPSSQSIPEMVYPSLPTLHPIPCLSGLLASANLHLPLYSCSIFHIGPLCLASVLSHLYLLILQQYHAYLFH